MSCALEWTRGGRTPRATQPRHIFVTFPGDRPQNAIASHPERSPRCFWRNCRRVSWGVPALHAHHACPAQRQALQARPAAARRSGPSRNPPLRSTPDVVTGISMTVPLDLNGPRTQDFEFWPDAWVDCGIIARFDAIAARHAGHAAIDDGVRRLSYAQVSAAARHLAARIDAACAPGAVGIAQSHSAAFWVAILACIGAGRTYAALDLHHPASRNAEILRDAGLAAVIVPPGFDRGQPGSAARSAARRLDAAPRIRDAPAWPCTVAPAPDVPAVVLYTSGSTGRPKGIANNQQALLQRVAQYVNACHLHAGDRMLTLSSPCTIAGTREGLTALLIGATLHVIDTQRHRAGRRSPAASVTPGSPRSMPCPACCGRWWADRTRPRRCAACGPSASAARWCSGATSRCSAAYCRRIAASRSATAPRKSTGTQWFVPRDAHARRPIRSGRIRAAGQRGVGGGR